MKPTGISLSSSLAILAFCLLPFTSCGDKSGETESASVDLAGFMTEPVEGTDFQHASKSAEGVLSEEGFLLNGEKNGLWSAYHQDGRIKSLQHYLGDKLHGVSLKFNNRGQIEEKAHFDQGTPDGYYATYRFGRPQEEMTYINGKLEGAVKKFYTNGKLREEIEFRSGVQHGSYKYYNEDGTLSLEYTYENGKKVSGGIVE